MQWEFKINHNIFFHRGTSAPNVVRMLLKKLEVLLTPTRTNGAEYINQREEKYFHGIPSTKSELQPRRYGRKPDCLKKPVKDLNFFKTMQISVNKPLEHEDRVCAICNNQENGVSNSFLKSLLPNSFFIEKC